MIRSSLRVWLIIAMVVAGIYVLPGVVATFAGSHTWELNQTQPQNSRVLDLKCGECHQYIVNEITLGNNNGLVGEKHLNASQNASYMNYVANMTVATGYSNMCKLCHFTNISATGVHTQVIIRPCTWSTCHGNSTDAGQPGFYAQAGAVGPKLGNNTEVHSNWFTALESSPTTTNYTSPDGVSNVTMGYYTCLGCHTHVGIDFDITRLNKYVLTIDKTGTYSASAATNTTSSNQTTSVGSQGTKWN